ncbi:MAG: response regulator, partial [Alphaproteobacteria bacterium]
MTSRSDSGLPGYRVLVVDDIPANIGVLRGILEPAGVAVAAAGSGEEALKLAALAPPDLVLLDVMMPGLDGFATCARLKADPALADVPVLFVT